MAELKSSKKEEPNNPGYSRNASDNHNQKSKSSDKRGFFVTTTFDFNFSPESNSIPITITENETVIHELVECIFKIRRHFTFKQPLIAEKILVFEEVKNGVLEVKIEITPAINEFFEKHINSDKKPNV